MNELQLINIGIELLEDGYSVEWTPSQRTASGVITLSYPDYDARLIEALQSASQLIGTDFEYVYNVDAVKNLNVSEMTREQLSTLLTWVQRSERFCDGAIDGFVKDGRVLQALRRAVEIECSSKGG